MLVSPVNWLRVSKVLVLVYTIVYYTLREPLQLEKHVHIVFDVELILLVCPRAGQKSSVYAFLSCVCL